MLNLTFLGTGGGMPMPNRFLSSIIMNFKGRKILLDCGEGTQVAMRKYNCGFKSLDLIFISHFHGDHIYGLPGLLSTMGNSGREKELYIIGPKGLREIMDGFLITLPYLPYEIKILEEPKSLDFIVRKEGIELKASNSMENSDLIIESLELEHSSPCLGYSFDFKRGRAFNMEKALKNEVPKILWSKLQKSSEVEFEGKIYYSNMVLGDERRGIKVSYTTDTRPTKEIPSFIKNSDLFICEGTYGEEEDMKKAEKNKHMTFREASILAKDGEVCNMILTHFSTAMNEPKEFLENATNVFFNTEVAEEGIEKTLNFREV
ncbi:ribonuclease Z [Clostridium sp.]|uniref:ribonuclease Z n=1 Tax=Clostridium sp. TaxID=1506 RepID=UPI00261C667C|nr:ribonuclease Z [Clostridium sp.]